MSEEEKMPEKSPLHTVVEHPKVAVDKNKLAAIQVAMERIEKTYGKGSIMNMGERTSDSVDVIPTGSLSLDLALGVGGVPTRSYCRDLRT